MKRALFSPLLWTLPAVVLVLFNLDLATSADPAATPTTAATATTAAVATAAAGTTAAAAVTKAKDPGVRAGMDAGLPLAGLTKNQLYYFNTGKEDFESAEDVDEGLGPTMNLDSCVGCHLQPAAGGSSPPVNPQVAFAKKNGARNVIPSFITLNGPVREARFIRNADGSPDGGVHSLFTIVGRTDAASKPCAVAQPDFAKALAARNVIFRIPTPVFGAGLIEAIPDSAILANLQTNVATKTSLGIRGRPNIVLAGNTISGQPNTNGNDGTLARFGWKAQNKSLVLFAGEAYNVEMGITNELFQTERNENPLCQYATTPNDTTDFEGTDGAQSINGFEKFSMFMRFLAPPKPSADKPGGAPSIGRGRNLFGVVGCAQCHTPSLKTGNTTIAAMANKDVGLFSDLVTHDMGPGLADGVTQGQAGPREFRTAPLWGLGQRIFFLHDGRTSDLIAAITAHASGSTRDRNASEANLVVAKFNGLTEPQKQDLLNFLRSL